MSLIRRILRRVTRVQAQYLVLVELQGGAARKEIVWAGKDMIGLAAQLGMGRARAAGFKPVGVAMITRLYGSVKE